MFMQAKLKSRPWIERDDIAQDHVHSPVTKRATILPYRPHYPPNYPYMLSDRILYTAAVIVSRQIFEF